MARPLRIEFSDGTYLVTNRGNYRQPIFETPTAALSFLDCLQECIQIHEWVLHAYVLMKNHFHLTIGTPQPNLSQGMHWLLSTWATRFNRYRKEQGHLFQGRYHAAVIEEETSLGHVVDYLHLNPATAKIVPVETIDSYRWSSLHGLIKGLPFPGLSSEQWLGQHGCTADKKGLIDYKQYLVELFANQELQRQHGWEGFGRGWAIGAEEWKRQMAHRFSAQAMVGGLLRNSARELLELHWEQNLKELLVGAGKAEGDLNGRQKVETWKLMLANELRARCGAEWTWMARRLGMGSANGLRSRMSQWQKSGGGWRSEADLKEERVA